METLDLEIYRGDTFVKDLTILDSDGNPIDVTNYSFAAQIKRAATSETVIAEFYTEVVDGPSGLVTMILTASETATVPIPTTSWVWDFQSSSDAATPVVTTHFGGDVTVVSDVTRV